MEDRQNFIANITGDGICSQEVKTDASRHHRTGEKFTKTDEHTVV